MQLNLQNCLGWAKFPHSDSGHSQNHLIVERRFRHTKSGKLYEVSDLVFCPEDDTWQIEYIPLDEETGHTSGKVGYVRSFQNFFGPDDSGQPRFQEVE